MFGKTSGTETKGPASGMLMMLRSLGFDPDAVMQNVEGAKHAAVTTMQHFDARLSILEAQNAEILKMLREFSSRVVVPESPDATKQDVTKEG